MKFRNVKKFKKTLAISMVFGVCVFSTESSKEVKAIFKKKSPQTPSLPTTSIPGVRSAKILGTGARGISIREVKGVIQDSGGDITQRNMLLESVKNKLYAPRKPGETRTAPVQEFWELLQYEPDKYKRDLDKGIRSHTHIDYKNDIKVKVNVSSSTGELQGAVIKTKGKRHFMNLTNGDYEESDIVVKTDKGKGTLGISVQPKVSDRESKDTDSEIQVSSVDKKDGISKKDSQSNVFPEKILDVRPKLKGVLSDKSGEDKKGIRKGYSSQTESQKLIDDVYKTKGLNIDLLRNAIKDYTGEVEVMNLEKIYRFSGDDGNSMMVFVSNDGNLSNIFILNKGSRFEKDYSDDSWTKNLGLSLSVYGEDVLRYAPQANSQKLIDDIYISKGANQKLLYEAVKDYSGDVQIAKTEDIYRFTGENNNRLDMHMDKEGKITNIFIRNGDEIFEKSYGEDGELLFYKYGYFELPGMKSVLEKAIYKKIDEKGQTHYLAEEKDGSFTKVLEKGGDMFINVLSRRDASIYGKVKEQKIVEAKNKYGENKRVILESIVENGEKKTVAYQLDDGVWREVTVSDNGTLWLGSVLKYENLLAEVEAKLRKLTKLYARYGAPVVSGVGSANKLITGIIN